jgi:queuine tRNA-ribosyltransferase
LTPEKTIQLQLSYGTDVAICLDDCTHIDAPDEVQQVAVERTIAWAKRCKKEFQRLLEQKKVAEAERPLLFGVIQGGGSQELRLHCAEALLEIGFDGFGYGGWPLDAEGNLLIEMLAYVREIIPPEFPLHALGVGHPPSIVACTRLGYPLFDSAMPTRDARHGRLYVFTTDAGFQGDWFGYVYARDDKHIKADRPISPFCDCLCCRRYSLGYLHHLFKIEDSLFLRLATIHNLRFMSQLVERLRADEG